MNKPTAILVALGVLIGTTALAQEHTPAQKAEVERAKLRIALGDVNRRLVEAVSAGRVESIGDCYTEDAILMPPNAPRVTGRVAVVGYWKGLIESGKVEASVTSALGNAESALGYDAGGYSLRVEPKQGGAFSEVGKYVTVLRKGADGKWRIAIDIWNGDLPLQ